MGNQLCGGYQGGKWADGGSYQGGIFSDGGNYMKPSDADSKNIEAGILGNPGISSKEVEEAFDKPTSGVDAILKLEA